MNATFQDLQDAKNPRNGQVISDRVTVVTLLQELRGIEPPFVCQFKGANGFNLTIGVAHDFGCAALLERRTATLLDGNFQCGSCGTP